MIGPAHQSCGGEPRLAALDSSARSELEQIVERFERAWRDGTPPTIADYLPAQERLRAALLLELAVTDIEWRLRRGLAAVTEDYLSRFPELGGDRDAIVSLATGEFVGRRRAEIETDVAEFLERFPAVASELRPILQQAMARESGMEVNERGEAGEISSQSATPRSDVPRRVGRYELLREIGRGSFGSVYEAVDSELDRHVAVKLPRHSLQPKSEDRARFAREAHNLARLAHPAIVPVLDAGWSDGTFFIVCALIDGPTLADRLVAGPLGSRATAELVAMVAAALDHAHQNGIVHRDVKPSNILIDARGSPWLTDFGLATRRDVEATLTMEGDLLGTPAYMAPEQASGAAHRVDGRCDVFSLGAVLYECLTGQLPFVGSPAAILEQIRDCDPTPPRRLDPRIDRDLETICLVALEKRPADRYQTAAALADDLRRYLAGEPIRARPPGPARRLVKWARRRPALAALAGFAILATLAVTGLTWRHNAQLWHALTETDAARLAAEESRLASEKSRRQTESLLYAADMRLATSSFLKGDAPDTLRRLRHYVPKPGEPDRREFAWRRLWSLCHAGEQTLAGHTGDVYSLAVVDDGRQLVTAGRDGTLRLWPLGESARVETLGSHSSELNFVAVAEDGITAATGSDDGTIHLWNLAARREAAHFAGHSDWALSGAIAPSGDQLATAGRDNVIRLWALPDGALQAELSGHTSTVESLAYLPDGKSLASTGADCTLRLWNLASKSGAVVATMPLMAYSVACSHDGRRLATAGCDYNVRIWDVAAPSEIGCLKGHTEIVQCVAFSPDDRQLASASADGTVRVWDVETLTNAETLLGHASRVWSVAWLPDNKGLASAGGDGTIRLWRRAANRRERVGSFPTEVTGVCFAAGEGRIWVTAKRSAANEQTWIWNAEEPPTLLAAPASSATAARDVDVVVVREGGDCVRLYNGAGQPRSSSVELPLHVQSTALSPAGDLLAVGNEEGDLCLYDLPGFRPRWTRADRARGVGNVQFTPDGTELLVAAVNGDFVVTENVADVADSNVLPMQHMCRLTVSPNGRIVAAGCRDRVIRIWDREQDKELASLQGYDGVPQALAFSPDGQTLASGTSAGIVSLWHAPTWQELGSFKTSLEVINDVTFSRDGNTLAIGGRAANGEGQVVLWETASVEVQ